MIVVHDARAAPSRAPSPEDVLEALALQPSSRRRAPSDARAMFPRLALAVAWFACAIGVAIHAFAPVDDARPSAKASSVSCAACALVARDVAFFARTRATNADDALARACAGENLRKYDKLYSVFGEAHYAESSVPAGPRGVVDADASLACRRLARKHVEVVRAAFEARAHEDERAFIDAVCADDAIACERGASHAEIKRPLRLRGDWRSWAPRVALRAAPYFIVSAFVPILLLPSLYPPKTPE